MNYSWIVKTAVGLRKAFAKQMLVTSLPLR